MSKKYANESEDGMNLSQKAKTNPNLTEIASNTCFSTEQEEAFNKRSKLAKAASLLKKSFMPPESTQNVTGKFSDLKDRTVWTLVMLIAFLGFISLGNFYCALLVLLVIMLIYSELLDVSRYKDRNQEVKNYYLISWYFFFVCVYYFYIKLLHDKLAYLNKYPVFNYIFKYHNLISFMLYIFGFLIFIRSLTKGCYRYQFRSFAWIHLLLIIFVMSSSLIVSNVFNGLVWFILPASLVICNDISAYIFGRLIGKTQLSALSPKKTVEGFIGGLISTVIWSYVFSEIVLNYDFLMCPIKEISGIPFKRYECDTSDLRADYLLSYDIPFYKNVSFSVKQIQFHTFALSLFASLLAPLGGLFASGFKRAIKIKDFANTIPGHGGLTDRMDCQILMV
jgi:phosphatidate cytidylyltransferase